MYSGLSYIKEKAPPSAPPGQPPLSSFQEYEHQQAAANNLASQSTSTQPTQGTAGTQPSDPSQPSAPVILTQEQFAADIRELSRDLVVKEQQLELLIKNLPGIGSSEKEQVERMKELERRLEELEGERMQAESDKDELVQRVEGRIMGVQGL
jgi:mediator of RNA polymerase II transcription subunit 21